MWGFSVYNYETIGNFLSKRSQDMMRLGNLNYDLAKILSRPLEVPP